MSNAAAAPTHLIIDRADVRNAAYFAGESAFPVAWLFRSSRDSAVKTVAAFGFDRSLDLVIVEFQS